MYYSAFSEMSLMTRSQKYLTNEEEGTLNVLALNIFRSLLWKIYKKICNIRRNKKICKIRYSTCRKYYIISKKNVVSSYGTYN